MLHHTLMKTFLTSLAVILVVSCVHFFWEYARPVEALSNSWVGCVIRPDANGDWYIIGGGHNNIGCTGITQDSNSIDVSFTTMTKIVTSSIDADEAMTINGYSVGASIGYNTAYIQIGEGNIDPSDITSGNIFVMIWGQN